MHGVLVRKELSLLTFSRAYMSLPGTYKWSRSTGNSVARELEHTVCVKMNSLGLSKTKKDGN